MPASTSTSYTDAPTSSVPPDDSYYIDADGNPVDPNSPPARREAAPADPTKVLVSFYGAGQIPFGGFGNVHLAAINSALGGTLNSTQVNGVGVPYLDWQMDQALHDLLANLDTNNDLIITPAEIAAKTVNVIGYSWGAVEAANFTRMLSALNPHLLGIRQNTGTPKYPHLTTLGGYNLEAAVPIDNLVTIDPILNAVFGLSGLIKTTDGPLANVINFKNYYETKGGTATVEEFSAPAGGIDLGPDPNFTLGTFFSAGLSGDVLHDHSENPSPSNQINVNTQLANFNIYIPYRNSDGTVIYGRLKGSQVQHDAIPFYVQQMVIDAINNS